jgi:hypothetical protein
MSETTSVFRPDPNRLDEEWQAQPELYHEAAVRLAEARNQYDMAKFDKDVVEAELDEEVRSYPHRFGLEKLTEPGLKQAIIRSQVFCKACRRLIKAKHAMDKRQADVDALDHRKKALENLVQLRLADYFSEPRVPRRVAERQKQSEVHALFRGKRVR